MGLFKCEPLKTKNGENGPRLPPVENYIHYDHLHAKCKLTTIFFIFVPYIFVLYIIVSLPRKLQGPVWMWQVWHSEYLYLYLYVYLYLHLHLHLHLQGPIMTMTSVTQQWRSDWGAFCRTAKRTWLQIAPRRHIFFSF